MSWLSEATGVHISPKGVSIDPGKLLGNVASFAVGGPGGLALNAARGSLGGSGGAAQGGLPQGIHGILNLAGGGAGDGASSAVPMGVSGASNTTFPSESDTGIPGQSGLDGILGDAKGWLTGNGGKNLLGAAQGLNAALQQKKSNDLANQALATVEGRYNAQAPLRAQGLAGLTRKDPGNPYYTGSV